MNYDKLEAILKKTIADIKDKNKFALISVIGSLKMEADIDLIIMPAIETKKGDFLKHLCYFLDALRKNLENNSSSKMIAFMPSLLQREVEFISKIKKDKDLLLHVSSFPDLELPEKVVESILTPKRTYLGSKKNVHKITTNIDFYYDYLFFSNCLYSNYPIKLETEKINKTVSYIYKNNGKKSQVNNKSNKEIYFECCDFLDSAVKPI